jgi:phage-related protein (TIGR01555 family)|nr:MAG TPA_asm: portal [Caudoviricetes sp.]
MSKFYPSKPKQTTDWKGISDKAKGEISLDISSPIKFSDSAVNACFDKWQKRFMDEWVNPIANIGVGNSITQYTMWINKRISYAECAFLANDSIINNAISKIANEIFRKGGKIVLENQNPDFETEFIKKLEKRIDKLKFFDTLHKAVMTTLTYGGALIYIDTNIGQNSTLADPIYFKKDFITSETITNLRVIEPYLCGAVDVNSSNPLNADFMQPSKWYISGAGVVDKTRLVSLSFFNAPDMLKPLYNYFGISLPQFMKDFVKIADGARQALGDIFTRFRTTILKTDLSKISAQEAMDRVGAINKLRNNLGTLLLTSDEEYVESITNLTNLDKLLAQMQENIAVSARMPAVKLLGLTPSGFNATGDFDLKSYYDEVMSYQNSIVKPIIENFLHIFSLELGFDLYPKYEFENLNTENALNQSQINATESQVVNNLIQSGVITQEQGFNYLQGKKIIDKGEEFDESVDDFGLESDLNYGKNGQENEQTQITSQTDNA